MGAVEDQVAVLEGGDYHGVALLPFRLDTVAKAGEALLIVGLVEDQALRLHQAQVVKRGDQAVEGGRSGLALGVSPAAAPDKVQQYKPAEEEDRDHGHEPYDAKE